MKVNDYIIPSEQDFITMLDENYDLNRFLLWSPYSSDPVLNYGGVLSRNEKTESFMNFFICGRAKK